MGRSERRTAAIDDGRAKTFKHERIRKRLRASTIVVDDQHRDRRGDALERSNAPQSGDR